MGRLWQQTGCQQVIGRLLEGRKFEFPVERAMAWLGEALDEDQQFAATPFAPRCTKDRIEGGLFAFRRDLLASLDLVFFDTTSILETRPIWQKCDETIRRHVFCSFLALVLRKELEDRLESNGQKLEWADITRDLTSLQYAEVQQDGKRFLLRSEAQGTCGGVFAAAGVALPPTVQQIEAP